jgi:hypothetical protein
LIPLERKRHIAFKGAKSATPATSATTFKKISNSARIGENSRKNIAQNSISASQQDDATYDSGQLGPDRMDIRARILND